MSKDCKKKLTCKTCKKPHPTVLHIQQKPKQDAQNAAQNPSASNKPPNDTSNNLVCGLTGAGSMSLVPVLVHSRETGITVETLDFLDNGSDAVFISEELQQQLNAKGETTKIQIRTVNNDNLADSVILSGLELSDINRENIIPLPEVFTIKQIPGNTQNIVMPDDIAKWEYLQEVKLDSTTQDNMHVGILIGNNVPKATEPLKVINSQHDGPYACHTPIGWIVYGIHKPANFTAGISVNRITVQESIESQLVKLHNHDFQESLADDMPEKSMKDNMFLTNVEETIKLTDQGHYEIGLPLEDKEVTFPNNRVQAQVRAAHLRRKLSENQTFYTDYKTTINDMIKKGYAERVPEEELDGQPGRTWYIPHHGVCHPKKNKLRVVYDCAASYKGVSLNKELLQGPDLTSSLHGVIMRFRKEPIALMGDIEAMFHQVMIPRKDRDLLRFLWWQDSSIERPIEEYRMCVHPFGATSSPAIANFALKRTAETARSHYGHEVIDTMLHNFYVDDCLRSVPTEAEAIRLVKDLKDVCRRGGFRLTKWLSNNREVLKTIPQEDRVKNIRSLDLNRDPLPAERALGMRWKVESDTFGYSIDLQERPATRRGILSTVSSVYDPLGLIAPVILPAKHILQSLCQQKLGWDQPIPCGYLIRWQEWLKEITKLSEFEVDRCLKPPHTVKAQLHHFCDASEVGYGTVTYLRTVTEDDKVHCSLLMSKSRVAPLKKISIPRLELTSATVAVKVNQMIVREFDIGLPTETFYWTDSMTVLRYINNSSARFHTFVANRVAVIQDGSEPSQWRYVNTTSNPADECSRGLSVVNFLRNTRWTQGPDFLYGPESEWPKNAADLDDADTELSDDPEVKQKITVASVHVAEESASTVDKLLEYHSSWYRLKRAVSWVLRVKKFLLQKVKDRRKKQLPEHHNQEQQQDEENTNTHVSEENKEPETSCIGRLTLSDLQEAERAVIRYVQQRAFHEEIKAMSKLQVDNPENQSMARSAHSVKKSSPLSK